MVADPWEARLSSFGVGAIYLHVPFCVRKCAYCDFASWATDAQDPLCAAYARGLRAQLDEVYSLGIFEDATTAYVGGGTPTLLGLDLVDLVDALCSKAPNLYEVTFEANPESLSLGLALSLRHAGATRVSIGVQSLDDVELKELGRIHDATTARDRVEEALSSGLDVSVDLMCAIPHQTDVSWETTLTGVIGMGIGHVSVYPLTIEEGTILAKRYADDLCSFNDEDVQAKRMLAAEKIFETHGLIRYEVASYALTGHECAHNIAYWTGVPYLGLGTGASSMVTVMGYMRLRTACPQLPSAPEGTSRVRLVATTGRCEFTSDPRLASMSFDLEFLNEAQAAAEDLMLGARLVSGFDPGLLVHARSVFGPKLDWVLEGLVSEGFLEMRNSRLAPTTKGWLLGNEVFGRLWDLAPSDVIRRRC